MKLPRMILSLMLLTFLVISCSTSEAPEETDLAALVQETHWLRQPPASEAEIFFSFCPNTDLIITRREDLNGVTVDTHSQYRYEVNTSRNTLLIYWTDEIVEYSWSLSGDVLRLEGVSLDREVELKKNSVALTVCD